ncbi:6-carboxytetrahydropterin synthase QueD [Kingella negevensis]|uniref:6-carboxy-5,6,7,8-tetrahydropterin synthase n=1 Tax=Kingella negevensis TaxID=1522312 RepID=A0A238HGR3_9NEIS|nr:6-carboxytetrahydropterin synthase QueD [Kingella negevensis]MDK4684113.1 6-carboxytetrahydropterin synthase QueD [Kingella negevensis]MDK4689162.1 6-carboxytetrahydropterin synthase QueD [Kingella negevensis]MDK4697329.1 6-carboxytetrahydropterin synthase QueD [Kingella negevensis]MDK4706769.1 6-carboxytetrahydropterin synthase QueD [Kingella negevensis]MDK4708924.1 6-carboxytetrahydropterin synthase QueD [Kingella negevensis]
MFKTAKEFSFDMAHMLDGHDGKCQNLHGHTYILQVEITGSLHETGAKKGMVMDFADLKAQVKTHILDKMDHAFIYDTTSERESQVAQLLNQLNSKTYGIPTRTTAEEMTRHIYNVLKTQAQLPISLVRLWETPTSYCEYSE